MSVNDIFPFSFSTVLGQEKAKRFLDRALVSGRLAHGYLFRGPDGVGKQLMAHVLAARLNCAEEQRDSACGNCSSCRKYASGNHPDIVVLSPENGTIKIDRVRQLCHSLAYPPYESRMRVVIFEDIHTMRTEAANSLLKTLEEPPENNLLILTAESSKAVLSTIESRCQTVPFYGLSDDQTAMIVRNRLPDLNKEETEMLGRLAEGSPGRALLLWNRDLITIYHSVVLVCCSPPGTPAGSVSRILQCADLLAALKENLIPLLGLIRLWVRDQMVEQQRDGTKNSQFLSMLASLDRAEKQLGRNCNRSLVCEVLLFNLQSPVPRVFS